MRKHRVEAIRAAAEEAARWGALVSAGLTSVRVRDYAVGTMIGIIPGTLAYVAVGAYGVTG